MKNIRDLDGKIYMTCSACMSVWADALSWANAHPERLSKTPLEADNLVVLSCQVTDLAILNDLKIMEKLHNTYSKKRYFFSGCLAKRNDVEILEFAERLETPKEDYEFLFNRDLVNFEKPFWVNDFKEQDDKKKDGHLFRDMYPLRIGKGCPNKCTYCTIRITRGDFEKYSSSRLEKEFLNFDNILLVADSPTVKQLKEWYSIAVKHNKGFSVRNVEPSVTVRLENELISLAQKGLLNVYHSPIQSNNPAVLKDMNRNVRDTLKTISIARRLKELGVYIATNIIIDYKNFNQDFSSVYKLYDYVSWNPLWNSKWDRKLAEERFEHYLGNKAQYNETLKRLGVKNEENKIS